MPISLRRTPRVSALVVALATGALLLSSTSGGSAAAPRHHKTGHHSTAAKTVPTVTATFAGANTGAIPDAVNVTGPCGTATTAGVREVTFPVSGITSGLTNVSVSVTINHTFMGDITLSLIAPDNTTAPLAPRVGATTTGNTTGGQANCGYGSNYLGTYVFADTATLNPWTAIGSAPADATNLPAGNYRSTTPLTGVATTLSATFAGVAAVTGTWKLRIADTGQGDTGSVTAAALTLTGKNTAPCTAATAKVAAAQTAVGDAGNKAAGAAVGLQKAKSKLKKAKKSGNANKIKKAKARVKRAKGIKKSADAAVASAQAALAAAQAEATAVC
jgi:subtilisin-like proprotein convertase family protein